MMTDSWTGESDCRLIRGRHERKAVDAPAAHEAQAAQASTAGAVRRQVLVVDDNHDSADSLAMLLRARGHVVEVAYNGADALRMAAGHLREVAVLDIGMPGLDGYEVARRLRRQARGPGLVLVAVTGRGQREDQLRARSAGFDHHFTKPVEPAVLERVVQDCR